MTSAISQPRSVALVQADLEAFEAIVKDAPEPPPGDNAAQLQWEVWQNHRAELKKELEAARRWESKEPGEESLNLLQTMFGKVFYFLQWKPSRDSLVAREKEKTQDYSVPPK